MCVEFIQQAMQAVLGIDPAAAPLFRYEPTAKDLAAVSELLKAAGDGPRLLALAAGAGAYAKSKWSDCARFAGAYPHVLRFVTDKLEAQATAARRDGARAAAASGRADREAAIDAERREAAAIRGEFAKLPPTSQRHWADEARRRDPRLSPAIRAGPLALEQRAAELWWNQEGRGDGRV